MVRERLLKRGNKPKRPKRGKAPTYITPDGVQIHVDWALFVVNASVFIPCINTQEAIKQLKMLSKRMGVTMKFSVRIEDDKWGVRVWRIA